MSIRDLYAKLPQEAPDYLAWVRSLPSGASGLIGCQAHHRIGGRLSQRKTSDFEAMPLTPREHAQLHAGMDGFEREHGKTEWEMVAKTLLEAIRLGVLVLDKRAARELGPESRSS